MKLEDAIFNWLQIAVVYEARPNDLSARDTSELFQQILIEDHQLSNIRYERDAFQYVVFYEKDGKEDKKTFPLGLVDKLIEDIENEPKYNQQ